MIPLVVTNMGKLFVSFFLMLNYQRSINFLLLNRDMGNRPTVPALAIETYANIRLSLLALSQRWVYISPSAT